MCRSISGMSGVQFMSTELDYTGVEIPQFRQWFNSIIQFFVISPQRILLGRAKRVSYLVRFCLSVCLCVCHVPTRYSVFVFATLYQLLREILCMGTTASYTQLRQDTETLQATGKLLEQLRWRPSDHTGAPAGDHSNLLAIFHQG